MTTDPFNQAMLCRIEGLATALAISRTGTYRLLARDPRAPTRVKVGRLTRFLTDDVERFVRELKEDAEEAAKQEIELEREPVPA